MLCAAPLCAARDPDCIPAPFPGATQRVVVRQIVDGDTLTLADGARVRLIGIDTPELGRDGRPDDPGAAAARDWLAAHAGPGSALAAATDTENRDRHGRLLRHLFLPDGTNLQAALLEAGLATPLVMPPSLAFLSCYHAAADRAAAAGRGLWGRPEYRPAAATALGADTRGYRVVNARVLRLHRSRDAAWLELEGPLSVSIPAGSLPLFAAGTLEDLAGTTAQFRGMVYPRGRGLRLYLRHPVDLSLDTTSGNPAARAGSNP